LKKAATDKNKKATIIILPQERSLSFYSSLNLYSSKKFKKDSEILISPSRIREQT